jgi:DNA-binding ferritin-like protein
MGDEKVAIEISKELVDKVAEKIEGTSITSVEEYIELLLENEFPEETEYTAEEEELIRERLRRLGYIE